jgi:hypothetical protein
VAAAPSGRDPVASDGPLELLHVEGRYAVYRVRQPDRVTFRDPGSRRD